MAWIKKRRLRYGYNFYEEEVLLLKMIRFHFISKQYMRYIVKPKITRVFNREVLIEILNDLKKELHFDALMFIIIILENLFFTSFSNDILNNDRQ
jgi:hypothetical protein